MWANTWHLSKLTAAIPQNTKCFFSSPWIYFFTLWKVKPYSAKSNLIWTGICRTAIFVVTHTLLFIRQKNVRTGSGFGKSRGVLDPTGSCMGPSRDCTRKTPEKRDLSRRCRRSCLPGAWIIVTCETFDLQNVLTYILRIKIYLKDVYTSVFSNCSWPLNTD